MADHILRGADLARILDDVADLLSGEDGGDIIVLSGAPQSGRSTMLRHLADGLADQGWSVVRVEVDAGAPRAPERAGMRLAGWAVQGLKVAGTAVNLALPVAGNIMALLGEIATAVHMRAGEPSADPVRDPYLLMSDLTDELEAAAADNPVALVVDDADHLVPPQVWWDGLFGVTLPRLMENSAVLAVLGVDGSAAAGGSYARTVVSDRLLENNVAVEVELAPLTVDDVRGALGDVEESLVAELVRLGQGRPGWVAELLSRWFEAGIVVDDGGWRFGADGYARARASQRNRAEALVQSALPDDYDRARSVLRLGSLEGPTFTAEAVAAVRGDDSDALVGWIDRTLANSDPPLVEAVADADGLRRYRICSSLLAGSLRETTLFGSDGPALAGRYAHALFRLSRDRPQLPFAWTIARLAAHARDTTVTEAVWQQMVGLESLSDIAARVRLLAERTEEPVDDGERLWLTGQLNALVRTLFQRGWRLDDTAFLARKAEMSARALQSELDGVDPVEAGRRSDLLVGALETLGSVLVRLAEGSTALALLDEAAELSATGDDHTRSARLHLRAVQALEVLNASDRLIRQLDRVTVAVAFARRAPRGATGSVIVVDALSMATEVYAETGRGTDALVLLAEAASEAARSEFRRSASYRWTCGNVLAAASSAAAHVRHPRMIEFGQYRVACQIGEENQPLVLCNLASFLGAVGRFREAYRTAGRALRLAQLTRATYAEALALSWLAWCAQREKSPMAVEFLLLATDRWDGSEATGSPDGSAITEAQADLAKVDDVRRQAIRETYAADGGASLLRKAFGIDVAEIDLENARQRPASRAEMVGYIAEVEAWCRSMDVDAAGAAPGGTGEDTAS